MEITIGVDEVGRGPWAGPIHAAAVCLEGKIIAGLRDSKEIKESEREELNLQIKATFAFGIGMATVEEIDKFGLATANKLVFERALSALWASFPHLKNYSRIVIDGRRPKKWKIAAEFFTKGENLFPEIAAASIVAKVHRDNIMTEMGKIHPHYKFESHKGYGTKSHQEAIRLHGILPGIHRCSFAPIQTFQSKTLPSGQTLFDL